MIQTKKKGRGGVEFKEEKEREGQGRETWIDEKPLGVNEQLSEKRTDRHGGIIAAAVRIPHR